VLAFFAKKHILFSSPQKRCFSVSIELNSKPVAFDVKFLAFNSEPPELNAIPLKGLSNLSEGLLNLTEGPLNLPEALSV
jgi:hypothetical protein